MATTLHDMPEDIIISILSRLPVKSLLRFRCVCQSWHTLVTDPTFIDLHLKHTCANRDGYVLIQHGTSRFEGNNFSLHCDKTFVEKTRLELPFYSSVERLNVEGYCNGLLCLSTPHSKCHEDDIFLWNPAVQKFKPLPKRIPCSDVVDTMYIAFGFAPQINDYRVVKFVSGGEERFYKMDGRHQRMKPFPQGPLQVEIYSLRLNSWKQIQSVVPYQINYCSTYAIVNGVVHWVADKVAEADLEDEFILSFDMAKEVFGEIKLPETVHYDFVDSMFPMVLMESLSLFIFCGYGGKERVDIWVMKEYGAAPSWTKQFTFDWRVDNFLFPLGFMKNGEVLLQSNCRELVLYESRVKQVKYFHIHGFPKSVHVFAFTYYMESLILLDERN